MPLDSVIKKTWKSYRFLFGILFVFLSLITTLSIPAWIAASKVENNVKAHFSFIFYALENSSTSIDELKRSILSYNKTKFIENHRQQGKNIFAYLTKNENAHKSINDVKIVILKVYDENKINLSKVVTFDPGYKIVFSVNENDLLNIAISPILKTFFQFKFETSLLSLDKVRPNWLLTVLVWLFSMLTVCFYATLQHLFKQKLFHQRKWQTLELNDRFKTAYIKILSCSLEQTYSSLEHVFKLLTTEQSSTNVSFLNKLINDIRQSVGRLITFKTLERNAAEIELIEEINTAIECSLEHILNKRIHITKHNLSKNIYVKQTSLKNLLILSSIMHLFIINLPPRGQLNISVKSDDSGSIKLSFQDNMPLPWKCFTPGEGLAAGLKNVFLNFEQIMYACADEEIKVEHSNLASGNVFTLEYQLAKFENILNVIKGNFR